MNRPALLYVVHRVPYPPDKGDRIRSLHLLKHLARDWSVHLACFADEPVAGETIAALRDLSVRLAVVPLGASRWACAAGCFAAGRAASEGAFRSRTMRDVVQTWTRETAFAASLASSSSVADYLRGPGMRDVPAVIDLMDVDSQKWFDYAATSGSPRSWLHRAEGRRVRRLEAEICGWARAVTLVSDAELRLLRSFCATRAAHAIPNGVDLEYFRPGRPATETSCVFVGALDYPPNVDAVCWFSRHVWPRVRERHPSSTIYVVGRRPVRAVLGLARLPGVNVVADVTDVRPYLARSAVAIAPLRIARGVQNKVLEALAMGKAVVASPQALTGIDAEPGVHLRSADAPQDWVEAIVELFDDASLRQRLGNAGRRFVSENHSWERCLEPIGRLLGLTCESDAMEGAVCECR